MTKTLRQLPSVLPPTTLEAMKTGNRNSSRTASVSPNASGRYNQNFGATSPVPRPAPVARQYTGPLQHPQLKSQQLEWSITPQDRAKFDSIFVSLDKSNAGVIGAEEVVPFLTTSTLPEETLAQVWDLADVHNTGQFTKTEFAIAMYLVQQKLGGKTLPITLPASLYPGEVQPVATSYFAQPQAQPQRQPPPKPPAVASSSLNDLLSLGDSMSTLPQPGASASQISENRTGSMSVPAQLTGVRSAFVPTSSFGQSIADKEPQFTSPPVSQAAPTVAAVFSQPSLTQPNFAIASPPPQQPQQPEFLDLETASKLSTLSTDNANLTNQVNSIGAQSEQAKQKRERAEAELSRVLGQKADLEARLATLRAEYDAEVKKSNQAEQLLHQSQQETDKLSADYSVLEASYHAVQTQCQEISSQLAYDQQENANLKEKIRFVSEETTNLKQTLEKLQKDARQQKGLVSINQKQYAHAEGERDKVQGQINDFSQQSREVHAPDSSSVLAGMAGVAGVAAGAVIGAGGTAGAALFSSPSRLPSASTPTSTNPFYAAFTPQPLTESTPSFSTGFEDRFGQMEIASPSTADPARSSTHNTVDTPNSSPPSSDYQYNTVNARIPTFTLPLARPESATSSVQNNPPMSVRDDIDISRPDSPEFPVTSEPVSGIVPPDDLVIRPVEDSFERGTNLSTSQLPFPVDNLQHGTGRQPSVATVTTAPPLPVTSSTESFEIVPRAGELPPHAVLSSSSESVETTHAPSVPAAAHSKPAAPVAGQPVTSNNTGSTIEAVASDGPATNEPGSAMGKEVSDANKEFDATFKSLTATATGTNHWPATAKGEFPPIKELDYDESSSDDDDFKKAFTPSAGFPASSASFPSTATSAGTDMFVSAVASPAVLSSPPKVSSTSSTALSSPLKVSSAVTSSVAAQPVGAYEGSFASAPSFSLPMPTKEADPFDAAFDGLVVADEEKEDLSAMFPTSNAPFNFAPAIHAPPPFTGPSMFAPAPAHPAVPTAAAPAQNKSGFDLFSNDPAPVESNTGVPVSNEEWDSIFAGFGSPNAAASQMDINNVFAKAPASQAAPALPKSLSPQSQALSELVNMGFDKAKALEALKKNNFNVENAGNYLLDH